jgi:hypothetical protein
MGPDFYLRNEALTGQVLANYLSDASNRIVDTTKMCRMLALQESTDVLQSYESLKGQISNLPNIDAIAKELGYNTDLATSMKEITNKYISIAYATADPDGKEYTKALTKDQQAKMKDSINKDFGLNRSEKFFDQKPFKDYIDLVLNARSIPVEKEKKTIDLLEAARKKTLIDLLELYSGISNFMSEQGLSQDLAIPKAAGVSSVDLTSVFDDLTTMNKKALSDIKKTVTDILQNFSDSSKMKDLLSKSKALKNGLATRPAGDKDKTYLGLPAMQRLQNLLANKVADFIRLTSFLEEAATLGRVPSEALDVLGEYGMIGYWNWQQLESNFKMIDMLNSLTACARNGSSSTLKMFPTFKFFFVEEDSGIIRRYDELFTYDAIQSIEIVKSKDAPGSTAVVRLSNITGTLTDTLSLHREKADLLLENITQVNDNVFFGTLNIKPGCGIIIKMGYAAHSDNLETIFAGRITEMNVGNTIEMICQSYSTQLNHKIMQHKFSLLSKEKGHGDIATATLDIIPGLDRLGKKLSLKDVSGIRTFNSSNIGNYRGTFMDRFLMGHIFGRVLSSIYGAPNPRDENIYLPMDPLGASSILYRPTFDWIIYDQTAWSVMQELSLFYQNTIPCIKMYNNDSINSVKDIRETLVIGNKSGYYKSTDAFSLSTLNIKNVEAAIDSFGKIREFILNLPTKVAPFIVSSSTSTLPISMPGIAMAQLHPDYRPLFLFLQDRLNSDVFVKFVLARLTTDQVTTLESVIAGGRKTLLRTNNNEEKLLFNLYKFSRLDTVPLDKTPDYNFIDTDYSIQKRDTFVDIINELKNIVKDSTKLKKFDDFNLRKEEFYTVSDIYKNTDPKLSRDPRYTKIQQHHLITDATDILSNNISLSDTFKNAVNLYYWENPKFVSSANMDPDTWKTINLFPIKAFGDQRDEFTRPLDIFEKNVDTNFWDAKRDIGSKFKEYTRIYNSKSALADFLKKGNLNLNEPNWDALPSFVTIGINLLKNEVAKMYQGTIEIIGNPYINPYDVIHIEDYTNDMHGAVEVEEIVHSFTPDQGFRTIITPNLVTYDRDPIQGQDMQIISEVYRIANDKVRIISQGAAPFAIDAAIATAAGIGAKKFGYSGGSFLKGFANGLGFGFKGKMGLLWAALGSAALLTSAYNGTVGTTKKYTKFIYDSFAKIWGRDCINFTTLIYQGRPFITGFGGVDYTNLKTIINHHAQDVEGPIKRIATFQDPFMAYFDPSYGIMNILCRNPLGLPGSTDNNNMGIIP